MSAKSTIKTAVRNRVPRPLLLMAKRAAMAGNKRSCSVCGASVRKFLPQGYGYPILEELEVIGGMYKDDDECPICRSNDRVRLVDLYVRYHTELLRQPQRLLHVAPEPALADKWSRHKGLDYVPVDLDPKRYRHIEGFVACDLQKLPFDDCSFDWVIANHVLEHIPDDAKAMKEVLRVLKPGGTAMLQVPIALKLEKTDEDPSITSEAERIRRFGQSDHVRIYARDYYDRLKAAGFEVELWSAFDHETLRARALRLNVKEHLTLARKPKAAA
jgi:SAM-dependent methyltransferase